MAPCMHACMQRRPAPLASGCPPALAGPTAAAGRARAAGRASAACAWPARARRLGPAQASPPAAIGFIFDGSGTRSRLAGQAESARRPSALARRHKAPSALQPIRLCRAQVPHVAKMALNIAAKSFTGVSARSRKGLSVKVSRPRILTREIALVGPPRGRSTSESRSRLTGSMQLQCWGSSARQLGVRRGAQRC
jgi:hypothetical protein